MLKELGADRRTIFLGVLIAALILILPAVAMADGFETSASATAQFVGAQTPNLECNSGGPSYTTASCNTGTLVGFGFDGNPASASASASANLATGSLMAQASSSGSALAQSGASFQDTLSFSGVSPGEIGTVLMTAQAPTTGSDSWASIGLTLDYYQPNGDFAGGYYLTASTNQPGSTCCGYSTFSDGTNLSVEAPVYLGYQAELFFQVLAYSENDSSVVIQDPITLTLPAGVTYTSASGEFLAGPSTVSSVPEPSTLPLVLVGLAALLLWQVAGRRHWNLAG